MEQELVERAGVEYHGIRTGQLRGKNPLTVVKNVGKMMSGIQQSRRLLTELKPDVCMVTGGYVCAPVVVACRQRRIPVLIYLPDMSPGSAIRLLSRLSQSVAVSFPEAAVYFGGLQVDGGKAVVTGYPVRTELVMAARDRSQARDRLAALMKRPTLSSQADATLRNLPVLLVWGGSQGSRSINMATWDSLSQLLLKTHVVHIVGVRDWEMGQAILSTKQAGEEWQPEMADRYHPVDYLHEAMPWALAAADLSVARAGASILGEFPVAGLPSVLAPLPIAGVNQAQNAQALASKDAAIILEDELLQSELAPTVIGLLEDHDRLVRMEQAARSLAVPDAADRIVAELVRLAA